MTHAEIKNIPGTHGGIGNTAFDINEKIGEGETDFYPSIKNGKHLSWDHPDYLAYKTKTTRHTVRFAVAGNAVSAEDHLKMVGFKCLACGHDFIDVYPEEGMN